MNWAFVIYYAVVLLIIEPPWLWLFFIIGMYGYGGLYLPYKPNANTLKNLIEIDDGARRLP